MLNLRTPSPARRHATDTPKETAALTEPTNPGLHTKPQPPSSHISITTSKNFPPSAPPHTPTMAQKATKTLAARNTTLLNRSLLTTALLHTLFLLLRALLFRKSFTRTSLILYILLSAPALLIQAQFEILSRPKYNADGGVRRAGEDLEAKGLTEWMWDVVYWTYGCLGFAAVVGDKAWWLYVVVPAYSAWLAWTTYQGVRGGYTDAMGVPQPGAAGTGTGTSKRQAKLEKRGGQRVQYR